MAVTYYSMKPDKELCITILFGVNGRGEYTLYAEEPATGGGWVDNHFTSFVAGYSNIISVPMCFSSRGRKIGENANIKVTVDTPQGNISHDYGICVSKYEDRDDFEGPASGNACDAMAGHTDIFSAELDQPEKYASIGEELFFTLLIDSSLPISFDILKSAEGLSVQAIKTTVVTGTSQQEVQLKVTAPTTSGDYEFSVIVTAPGCSIGDCKKTVKGMVHVKPTEETPQAGFFAWLTPESKSIIGQQNTMFVLKFENYGDMQELSAIVTLEEGLESDFSPYSTSLAKKESRSIPFTVRPTTNDKRTYKISATVTGADGKKRSADAWLTVDEMVADADKLNQDEFIAEYDASGGASLEDWEELRSVTGAIASSNGRTDVPTTTPTPNYMIWIITAVVIVIIAVLILFIYKRMHVEGEGGWESLGI